MKSKYFTHSYYLVPEQKLRFFVKVKEDQNFNRRNTWSILRIKILEKVTIPMVL